MTYLFLQDAEKMVLKDVEQAHGAGEKNIGGEHGECWPMRGQYFDM